MEIPRGRGFQKPIFLKEIMALKCNFQKGWGVQAKKKLSWEGYEYFVEQHIQFCLEIPSITLYLTHWHTRVSLLILFFIVKSYLDKSV